MSSKTSAPNPTPARSRSDRRILRRHAGTNLLGKAIAVEVRAHRGSITRGGPTQQCGGEYFSDHPTFHDSQLSTSTIGRPMPGRANAGNDLSASGSLEVFVWQPDVFADLALIFL